MWSFFNVKGRPMFKRTQTSNKPNDDDQRRIADRRTKNEIVKNRQVYFHPIINNYNCIWSSTMIN